MVSRRVVGWGVAASVAWVTFAGCADSRTPRKTPTAIGGEAGEPAACGGSCAGEVVEAAAGVGGAVLEASGGSPSAGAPTAPSEAGAPPARDGIELSAISIYQSVEVPLMQMGETVPVTERPAPVIANKRAFVRAFVQLEPAFASRPLLGVLDVENGARSRAFVSELSPTQSSRREDLATTFTFDVAGSHLEAGATYRLRVLDADTTPIAQFPESGYADFGTSTLQPFELVLVPMTVNGFAPRLSEVELTALRQRLLALFPAPAVELSIGQPLAVERDFDAEGEGWTEALDDLLARREQAQPSKRVFFYGVLAPAASYLAYCSGGCVLGLSHVAEPDADQERGSIGIGVFADGSGSDDAWDTLAHELGHALGREHADCGDPDDPDPSYPYEGGGMGSTYGFDFGAMRLIRPRQHRDIMSYCVPAWVSDYTYRALFDRLRYIDQEAFRVRSWSPPVDFRIARIDRFGRSRWGGSRSARRSSSRSISFPLLDAQHRPLARVAGRFARLDHLPGGSVWLEQSQLSVPGAHFVDLRTVGGALLAL